MLPLYHEQQHKMIQYQTMNSIQSTQNSINQTKGYNDKKHEQLRNNRLLCLTLKFVVKHIRAQYHIKQYDGNKVLRMASQTLKEEPDTKNKQEVMSIWPQIELFAWDLAICPKYWVLMFENQEFFSESETIDMHVFTSKIYRFVLTQFGKNTIYAELFCDIISQQLFEFYQQISQQICQCYQHGRQIIMAQTRLMEKKTKNSKILNFYFVFKLLKETSIYCQQKIHDQLSTTIFKNVEQKYSRSFTMYIIEKHQVLSLIFNKGGTTETLEKQPLAQIMEKIRNAKDLKWRHALRQDGQTAIIVEFPDERKKDAPPQNYMIKMDKEGRMKVLNCNTLKMKWTVTQQSDKDNDIMKIVSDKSQMAKRLRNSPTELKTVTNTYYFSTLGGAMGKCLADIEKYDTVTDFVFDLSKRSVISGTFNYVATRVPLLGILFVTGGFSLTLFGIFSNDSVNYNKKFQQVGYVTFDVASTIGTGLLGAAVGQALIPVPFLGAFLGAFVGGFVGQIGGKAVIKILQSQRFKSIIKDLENTIQPAGYWEVNHQALAILNLHKKNFYKSIPQKLQVRMGCDKIWYTMIGFTILSFHQSKRRSDFMAAKTKELKYRKQKQKETITFQMARKQLHFQASTDLECIMKWFESNKVDIITVFDELEQFVLKVFSLID